LVGKFVPQSSRLGDIANENEMETFNCIVKRMEIVLNYKTIATSSQTRISKSATSNILYDSMIGLWFESPNDTIYVTAIESHKNKSIK